MLLIPVTFRYWFPINLQFRLLLGGGASNDRPVFGESVVTFSNHLKQLGAVETLFNKLSAYGEQLTIWCFLKPNSRKSVMIAKKPSKKPP